MTIPGDVDAAVRKIAETEPGQYSSTAQDLARGAAEFVCDTAERSTGRFVISLAGGSTPKPMYQLLAQATGSHVIECPTAGGEPV